MGKNQSTYTLKIDAELGDLQKQLNAAKASLASFMASGNAPKGLEKAFEKINTLLGQFSDKTSKPLDLKGINSAEKDFVGVQETIHSIIRLLGDFKDLSDDAKISFLSPDEQKKINAATEALKKYEKTVESIAKKQKELDTAKDTMSKKEGAVTKSKNKVESLKGSRSVKQAKLEGEQGKLSSINVEGGNPEKIAKYEANIKSLKAEIADLDRQINDASTALNQSQSEYEDSAKSVTQLENEVKKANKGALHELKEQATEVGVSLEGLNGRSAAQQMEILTKRFEEFVQTTSSGSEAAFNNIVEGCEKIEESAQNAGNSLKEFKETSQQADEVASNRKAFEDKIKQFLGLSGAAKVLKASLRDAMQTITDLDATMTEMSVVTDLTVGDYWDQLPEYSKRANELGLAINDVYKADTLFYQQGLKTNEVVQISTETMKMARIAGLDTAEATDRMTAALRGFNMELNETSAQKIADVYSELAAITAADVDEISTAMTKTASIASSAGMEFETTAAFLSQIIETTRESAETAGTAMKTVIARFQELKKDPSEIGEVEGEIVDANKIETALRSVGVALRDSQGQFRDLDDVFMELSGKWDGLDKNTQRYIATIAAGSRQQSRFIAMMSDYGRTQELVTAANNSAGASQKQFEKTMESLSAKVEKLKNAWHEFTMGIMNSDFVKGAVDVLTKLLEVVNKATSAFGGMAGSIVKISSVLAIFKVGKSLFAMIPKRFKEAMVDVIRQAIQGGEDAAEAASDGAQKKAAEIKEKQNKEQNKGEQAIPESKHTFGQLVADKTGATDLKAGYSKLQQANKQKTNARYKDYKKAEKNMYKIAKGEDNEETKKKLDEATDELIKKEQEYQDSLNMTAEEQEKLNQQSIEGWNQITNGIGKAAASAMALGMAMSAVGGIFSSLGLEGVGETLTDIGNGLVIAGSLMSALIPVIGAVGKALLSSGVMAQLGFWPVLVIGLAIVAILGTIIAVVVAIRNASPEKKLKDAEEATTRAQDAADKAAESYQHLADALDSLGDKYKHLETLTRGTKEWTEAMLEVNQQVLDLTDKYPELIQYVKSEGGVLRLDTEDPAVQRVLQQKQAASLAAQNNLLAMKQNQADAQADVTYSKLGAKLTVGLDLDENTGDVAIDARNKAINEETRRDTEELAKKLASGELVGRQEDIKAELEALGVTGDLDAMSAAIMNDIDKLKNFGAELNRNEAQLKVLNDTAAANARAMADMTGFSEEEMSRADQIVDGEVYAALKEQATKSFNEAYDDMSKDEKEAERQRIIEKQYGAGAKLDDDGNVTLNGETLAEGLTEADIKALGIEQKASAAAQSAAENSIDTFNAIIAAAGEESADAIKAMYAADNGGALTQAQLEAIKKVDLETTWNNLSDEVKNRFGNSIEAFSEEFETAIVEAGAAFADAADIVQGYMTADMAEGYANNLREVAERAGGQEGKQAIVDATQGLLSGKETSKQQEIQRRINMTDWTNLEELLALQIDLEQQYGYSKDEAEAYVKTIAEAAYATSGLVTTVETFGDLWKATEKINQSMRRLTQLQWEYNEALKKGGDNVSGTVSKMLDEYKSQAAEYQKAYDASNSDLTKLYAQGAVNYDIDLTKFVELGENGINVDNSRLQDAINSGKVKEEDANKWIESLSKQYETSQSQLEGLRETLQNIEDLEQEGNDAYNELRDMAKEAILNSLQEQIDLQKDTLDATRDANSQLINTIQKQIDEDRQARENEKQAQNIADLQSKAASLAMDTSGANALGMADLDKQIAEAEQQYQDSLIDQTLQQLSDANEEAAEQRERQISLAEQSLEMYTESERFQEQIDASVEEMLANQATWQETPLGELLAETFTVGMSPEEKTAWANDIGSKVGLADAWKNNSWSEAKKEITDAINNITDGLDTLANQLNTEGNTLADKGKRESLATKGFTALTQTEKDGSYTHATTTVNGVKQTNDDEIQAVEALLDKDAKDNSISDNSNRIKAAKAAGAYTGEVYENAAAYYKANYNGSNASTMKSYSEYLAETNKGIEMFGDERKNAVIDAYEIPSSMMVVEDSSSYDNGRYEEWNFNEEKLPSVSGDGNLMKKVVMVPHGGTLTMDGVSLAAADYNGRYFYNGSSLYSSKQGQWWRSQGGSAGTDWQNKSYLKLIEAIKKIDFGGKTKFTKPNFKKYKTGGLADFTGPAWLDGTPTKPEYILNADQTQKFFSLVDVLEGFNNSDGSARSGGDNYFDISINVEKLDSDYDVEQIANKIRRMIYDDATYRNVNAVNNKR